MSKVLVLGSGRDATQRIAIPPAEGGKAFTENFSEVITVDTRGKATHNFDIRNTPWHLWGTDSFDEIHAYEILHLLPFFPIWREMWKVLKPGGFVVATVPWHQSTWAWNDPGTLSVYPPEKLWYLSQKKYEEHKLMTDYREDVWRKPFNFEIRYSKITTDEKTKVPVGFIFVAEKAAPDEGSH